MTAPWRRSVNFLYSAHFLGASSRNCCFQSATDSCARAGEPAPLKTKPQKVSTQTGRENIGAPLPSRAATTDIHRRKLFAYTVIAAPLGRIRGAVAEFVALTGTIVRLSSGTVLCMLTYAAAALRGTDRDTVIVLGAPDSV